MAASSIEWTELTWNPTTGCSKISTGCKFCYAEVMSRRLKGMGQEKYKDGFKVVKPHPDSLAVPYAWKGSKIVFVNSMSDLFHKAISIDFIKEVFAVMNDNPQHIFQVLTKRAERIEELSDLLIWSSNIWLGVSVENGEYLYRIDYLRNSGAKTKFLSLEPLLGPLSDINLNGIDWVIVGGESGSRPRPMAESWVTDIQVQCETADVPFFFKQWGGRNKKLSGRVLNGRTFDQMPKL